MKTIDHYSQRRTQIESELEERGIHVVVTAECPPWHQLVDRDGQPLFCYKDLLDGYTMEYARALNGFSDVISFLILAESDKRPGLFRRNANWFFKRYDRVW